MTENRDMRTTGVRKNIVGNRVRVYVSLGDRSQIIRMNVKEKN